MLSTFRGVVFFLLLPSLVAFGQLPNKPGGFLQTDFDEMQQSFIRKRIVEDYKTLTKDTGDAKTRAIAFLELYAETFFHDKKTVNAEWALMQRIGGAALQAGSDDPHFKAAFCQAISQCGNGDIAELARQSFQGFKESSYSYLSAVELRKLQIKRDGNRGKRTWLAKVLAHALIRYAKEAGDVEIRAFWSTEKDCLDDLTSNEQAIVFEILPKAKKVDPWILEMLKGRAKVNQAWAVRGGDYSHTVPEEAWPKFHELLGQAEAHYEKAHSLHPEFPEAATALIQIAMAHKEANHDTRYWLNKALEAQFDWVAAYDTYFVSINPKWGGSVDEIIEFGKECAATERYETAVPQIMLSLINACYYELKAKDVLDNKDVYAASSKVSQAYITYYEDKGNKAEADKYRSYRAAHAAKAKDWETVYQLAIELNGQFRIEYFYAIGLDPREILSTTAFKAGPTGSLLEETFTHIKRGNINTKELNKQILEIEKIKDEQADFVQRFATGLVQQAKTAAAFEDGDWASLKFNSDLVGWKAVGGQWAFAGADSSVMMLANGSEYGQLHWVHPVNSPYVIEVDIQTIAPVVSLYSNEPGIVAGNIESQNPDTLGRFFFVAKKDGLVGSQNAKLRKIDNPAETHEPNTLRIYAWKDYSILSLNGVVTSKTNDLGFDPFGTIGVGLLTPPKDLQKIIFSNFRIRKLDFEAPRPRNAVTEDMEYWNRWLEFDPKNDFALWNRGRLKFENDNFEEALQDLATANIINPKSSKLISGMCFMRLGKFHQAKDAFLQTLNSVQQTREEALFNLGWLEASCPVNDLRDGPSAVEKGMALFRLGPNEVEPRRLLAAAWATAGDFEKAVYWQEQAIELDTDRKELVNTLKEFKKGKPYISPLGPGISEMRKGPWSSKRIRTRSIPDVVDGLVARLPLDRDIRDMSENQSKKVDRNTSYGPGMLGNSLDLVRDSFVALPEVGNFRSDNSFSYGSWVQPRSSGTICGRMDDNALQGHILKITNSRVDFWMRSGHHHIGVLTRDVIDYTRWQHLFVTYDGSRQAQGIRIYLDGKPLELEYLTKGEISDIQTDVPFTLGRASNDFAFSGRIDEMRVYDRKLSAEEVAKVFAFGAEERPQLPK